MTSPSSFPEIPTFHEKGRENGRKDAGNRDWKTGRIKETQVWK